MKRSVMAAGLSILAIIAGVLVKDSTKLVSLVLIIAGIVSLLAVFWAICRKGADICPKCGTTLYRTVRTYRDKREGLIRCPKCESLVSVESRKIR